MVKALIKGFDSQKFGMCMSSSVMLWGPAVKEKIEIKKPLREPRMGRAACCNSELPLSETQKRGSQGCCWKRPSSGGAVLNGSGFF